MAVKIVKIGNKKTIHFFRIVIDKICKFYPDVELEVIDASELTLRPTVRVSIPPTINPVDTIMHAYGKRYLRRL